MKTVFMGTPDFAVPCLERLIADGHTISGVFTQPDKPRGRGNKIQYPPVKEVALKHDIPVYQPKTLRDAEALDTIAELDPELIVVVAYGKILPKEILDYPRLGCINMHASLLPSYRGAAPIQWCVINGERKTGVTSMLMDVGLDTGDMLIKRETPVGPDETTGELHDRLSVMSADVMSQTIDELVNGRAVRVKQDDSLATYAPMITKELCPIDWTKKASEIHDLVRGLSPWPVATAVYKGVCIKIHSTAPAGECRGEPGEITETGKRLLVCCGDRRALEIKTLQAPGKKAMSAPDFMRGHSIMTGESFDK